MTFLRILAVLTIAAAALGFGPSGEAAAHAALATSEPADGGMVAEAPAAARLTFSEPVAPLVLRLIGPDGGASDLAGATLEGDTLVVPLPEDAAAGTYVLSYRVVSQDGHPVGGSLVYAVGEAPPSAGAGVVPEAFDPWRGAAVWAARVALTGGVLFGVGGALFLAFAGTPAPAAARRAAGLPLVLAALAAAPAVGLQGTDALGLPLSGLAGPAAWTAGVHSTYAITVSVLIVAATLAAVSLLSRSIVWQRLAGLLGLAVLAFAVSLSGHASTAPPQEVTHRIVSLHVGAAAVWIGALAPLAVVLAAGGTAPALALRSFSRVAPYAVAVLVLSGLFLAAVQVQRPAALWTTDYGRVLLAKLALVAAMLGLAAVNRWRLTTPVLGGDDAARRRLVRVVAVETALAVAVVGTLALWRFTPPPRALAAAAAAPAEVHIHTDRAMATVTVLPGLAGPVAVEVALQSGDFGPLAAKEVTVAFANPAAGVEPIRRSATETGGVWRIGDVTLPVAGPWSVRIDVLVGDFEKVRLDGSIVLSP